MEKTSSVKRKSLNAIKIILIVFILILAAAITALLIYRHRINSTVSFSGVITQEQLADLDQYPNLSEVDLRGSTCYEAIEDYIFSHPDIHVIYSVDVDSAQIDSTITDLDWNGHSVSALTEAAPMLQQLQKIHLGTIDVSSEELSALTAAYPNAQIDYSVEFNGKTFNNDETKLDLSGIRSSQVSDAAELLRKLPDLKEINLMGSDGTSALALADFAVLHQASPDASFNYSCELYGLTISTKDTSVSFLKTEIGNDGVSELRTLLDCMPNLKELRVDRCDIDDEVMAQLRADYPDVNVVWRIFFWSFSCMTDTERIWAIGGLTDEYSGPLQYCTEVKYLDLGHNCLTDISFIKNMPNLEVAILAMNSISDISALAGCSNLEYLELTLNPLTDISPLASCTNLKHLELSQIRTLDDITPLYDLDLERFHMMYHNGNVTEQLEEFQELHPDCSCDFRDDGKEDPYFSSEWRYSYYGGYVPRYALLREQIGYDTPEESESYLHEY